MTIAESGSFTDHEKGDLAAEKSKLSQAKSAATSKESPPTTSPSSAVTPASTPAPPGEIYPLAPSKELEQRLTMELVPSTAINATLGKLQEIRKSFSSTAQKYLGFAPSDSRDANRITEADILQNLAPRTDVFHDVLFVSIKYNWNPDEVLALWQNEGLPNWIRATSGTQLLSGDGSWRWLNFPSSFKGESLTDKSKKALARSHILLQYWGLDILASYTYNSTTKDNQLTGSDAKAHDSAFDTGFNNQLSSYLPGVTAAVLREALTKDGIEFYEQSSSFRLKPTYQATLLALQHAHYKYREAQVIRASPLTLGGKVTANLTPPFPALIYLYYNSSDPAHSVGLMTDGIKKKKASYSSKELCDAFFTSELPPEVVKSLDVCRTKFSRLNCHGYMNAIRFEFFRRVYEKVFEPTKIGTPRGCPS